MRIVLISAAIALAVPAVAPAASGASTGCIRWRCEEYRSYTSFSFSGRVYG